MGETVVVDVQNVVVDPDAAVEQIGPGNTNMPPATATANRREAVAKKAVKWMDFGCLPLFRQRRRNLKARVVGTGSKRQAVRSEGIPGMRELPTNTRDCVE